MWNNAILFAIFCVEKQLFFIKNIMLTCNGFINII